MATSISSSSLDSTSSGNVRVTCRCNRPASVYTSNTKANPFRRFYKCRLYRTENGCDTWEWIDNELPTRVKTEIVKFMDQVDGLKTELKKSKEQFMDQVDGLKTELENSKERYMKMATEHAETIARFECDSERIRARLKLKDTIIKIWTLIIVILVILINVK
ncbi:hypothetical protein Dimus_016322 [Dionaea muscipula]